MGGRAGLGSTGGPRRRQKAQRSFLQTPHSSQESKEPSEQHSAVEGQGALLHTLPGARLPGSACPPPPPAAGTWGAGHSAGESQAQWGLSSIPGPTSSELPLPYDDHRCPRTPPSVPGGAASPSVKNHRCNLACTESHFPGGPIPGVQGCQFSCHRARHCSSGHRIQLKDNVSSTWLAPGKGRNTGAQVTPRLKGQCPRGTGRLSCPGQLPGGRTRAGCSGRRALAPRVSRQWEDPPRGQDPHYRHNVTEAISARSSSCPRGTPGQVWGHLWLFSPWREELLAAGGWG